MLKNRYLNIKKDRMRVYLQNIHCMDFIRHIHDMNAFLNPTPGNEDFVNNILYNLCDDYTSETYSVDDVTDEEYLESLKSIYDEIKQYGNIEEYRS